MSNVLLTPHGHLIVKDDLHRARWERGAAGEWYLRGIWPDGEERVRLVEHLSAKRGMVVIIDQVDVALSVLSNEIIGAAPLEEGANKSPIIDVPVPALDWLPTDYCDFAKRFRHDLVSRMSHVPIALRPPVAVSDLMPGMENFYVAVRLSPISLADTAIIELADHLLLQKKTQNSSGLWKGLLAKFHGGRPIPGEQHALPAH